MRYEGEFLGGTYEGQGTYTWADGSQCVLPATHPLSAVFVIFSPVCVEPIFCPVPYRPHGTSTCVACFPALCSVLNQVDRYVGSWLGGRKHGRGRYMGPNGTMQVGPAVHI